MQMIKELNYNYEAYIMYSRYVCGDNRYAARAKESTKEKIDFVYDTCSQEMDQLMVEFPRITDAIKVFEGEQSFTGFSAIFDVDFTKKDMSSFERLTKEALLSAYVDKESDVVDDLSLVSILEKTTLSHEQKWLVLLISENTEQYYDDLREIYQRLVPLLTPLLSTFANEVSIIHTEWQERIDNKTIYKFLEEEVGLSYEGKELNIQASVMGMNAIAIRSDTAVVGITFTKEFFQQSIMTIDEACKNLKNIGDQSKFLILKELVETQKYGKELADALDLTPATISYHIQELVSEGLVQVNASTKSNRIYYEIRKDKLFSVLIFVVETLELLDEGNRELLSKIIES
ncbi:helix-turn-helix transcriptional regulator [Erysipelothrix urinaevulpis]|uniref:ArsR/SmtB family transcription factor n=1 Tax=Erysipelothrix urinaevulpis TaxID=2683717 RepID=UPI0019155CA2|nr:winged helix-turn-helix domain-containing protein [Erysipelothrix urinaevulpis]